MNPVDAMRAEFLADIAETAERVALEHRIPGDVAEQIGCAVADMMCVEYAGIRMYINQDIGYRLAPRDREICQLHADGQLSVPELAKKFSLSEERIRQILKRRPLRDPDFGQGKLFGT